MRGVKTGDGVLRILFLITPTEGLSCIVLQGEVTPTSRSMCHWTDDLIRLSHVLFFVFTIFIAAMTYVVQ